MKPTKLLMILALGMLMSCSPQQNENPSQKRWFKGNLHTHSYWSDGDEFPEVIMDWYKSHGYQFVALSDHNTLAEGNEWVEISSDSLYQNAFQNYLAKYGSDWVGYRNDSNRLIVKLKTLAEYRGLFEQDGNFLVIQSEEISDKFDGKPLHMNATNIQEKIEPQGGNSVAEVLQNNINEVIKQRNELNIPMIPHINHPNFYYAIDLEDMISLEGERFFEVYNGHPQVHNMGDSAHISIETMWDLINLAYLENDKPLMYGLATDDSHHYHRKASKWSNAGRGWIMVQADSLTPASLIDAMENGRFYASSGVTLKDLSFEDNTLTVEIAPEEGINYTITFIGLKKGKNTPEEFVTTKGISAEFKLTKDVSFVRCRITSSKLHPNPIEDLLYEMAWTQPVK